MESPYVDPIIHFIILEEAAFRNFKITVFYFF